MKALSIIIVNYKTPQLTNECIRSIFEHTKNLDFEIIVVDNNSEDESKELITGNFPDVIWIDMGDNTGTSRGYNAGIKASNGKHVLILNSDTVVKDNAIKNSYEFHLDKEKENKLGLTSCQLKGFDGEIQFNSNLTYPNIKKHIYNAPLLYKMGFRKPETISEEERIALHSREHKTAWIGIAFGIINKRIFTEEKLWFDEDIFMYSDEVEWCLRLSKLGYKHYFTADYTIYHKNSGSTVTSDWRRGQIFLSELLYMLKVYGPLNYKIMCKCINAFLQKTPDNEYLVEKDVMKRYSKKITKDYKNFPSSGKTYLKYELN